jgi:NADPH-dependent curcumin reductase CurA
MSQTRNRQWRLARRPVGMVKESDFEFREEPVPAPGDGEILVRNLYISFDPAMRGWMEDRKSYIPPVALGDVMRAGCVGEVVESKLAGYAPGDFVQGLFGWQEWAVAGSGLRQATKLAPGTPLTWPLGVLGITGLTAYFGLLDLGKPKAGDTVLVSGAAGATGSVVAQIAKHVVGCRTVGIAGGREKCAWLTDDLGLDAAIDYKSENVQERMGALCPSGVDVYFDNVGGEILDAALFHAAERARFVLCGGISGYNEKEPPPGPRNLMNLITRRCRMEGFIVLDYVARFGEAAKELAGWVSAGKIQHKEDVQRGIENAPRTFMRLFRGENTGKQLLQVGEPKAGV